MAAKKQSIGDLIDELGDLNAEITAQNKKVKDLNATKKELSEKLMAAMGEQGLSKSGGKKFTASINDEEVAQVTDWDKFHAYIGRNKAYHLLQKRVSGPAMRELWQMRTRPVPGVDKVTLPKLSFRKA